MLFYKSLMIVGGEENLGYGGRMDSGVGLCFELWLINEKVVRSALSASIQGVNVLGVVVASAPSYL